MTADNGAAGWASSNVRAGGITLRVARCGEGPPLLLITGIGANIEMWGPFERVIENRELIAFDAPGAGLSERPRYPLRMRGLARVVAALLDGLGLDEVDVLGYSFGGGLAQELAYRSPDRVRRLILCATAQGLVGVPPRPLPALLLATPARYYHPRLFRLTVHTSRAGVRGEIRPNSTNRQPRASDIRPTSSATPSSSTPPQGGRAFRGSTA